MKNSYRNQFPIFENHPNLIYFDNAATTHRPLSVIEAETDFYSSRNANIHRGVYDLSSRATADYENTRKKVAEFLGDDNPNTVAFTKGTTESINVVANSFLKELKPKENIVVTLMEHHANFIPWQRLCGQCGAELRVVPILENGDVDMQTLQSMIDSHTQLVSIIHISNTLGTINPIAEIINLAHQHDVPVLIDAAQSAAYYDLNVKEYDYDFLVFSAHKTFGPFGVGVLYVQEKHHAKMQPYQVGGGIVQLVEIEETTYKGFPHNMEAGTPNVSGVIAFGAAIDFLNTVDKEEAKAHLNDLVTYGRERLSAIDGVQLVGSPSQSSGIISFLLEDIHPHDIASFLNKDHIAVRAGMHCTQPLLQHMELSATVRASFSIYNTRDEVNQLAHSMKELIQFWQ